MSSHVLSPRGPLRVAALVLVAGLALALLAGPALAGALEDLRKDGTVGERYDGYVEIRAKGASSEITEAVADINAKRRALYEKRAADQKVSVEQVGRVYAKQIYDDAPAGTWFLTEDKGWLQK